MSVAIYYIKGVVKVFDIKVERIIVAVAVVEIKKNRLDHWTNEEQGCIVADCLKACYKLERLSGATVARLVAAVVNDYI